VAVEVCHAEVMSVAEGVARQSGLGIAWRVMLGTEGTVWQSRQGQDWGVELGFGRVCSGSHV